MPNHTVWKQSQSFRARVKAIEEEQSRRRSTSPFANSGIHPNGAQGLDSDNYVAGASGFSLNGGTGVAEFKDVILYDLPNSMLASPVDPVSAYDFRTNFALTTTLTNIRTKTIPVPDGFTKAAVVLTVRVYAINDSVGLDYLYSQANINGFNGLALPVAATNMNGSAMNVSTFSAVLEGTDLGSNLVLQIAAKTAFGAWSADAVNASDLSASIAWYR